MLLAHVSHATRSVVGSDADRPSRAPRKKLPIHVPRVQARTLSTSNEARSAKQSVAAVAQGVAAGAVVPFVPSVHECQEDTVVPILRSCGPLSWITVWRVPPLRGDKTCGRGSQ